MWSDVSRDEDSIADAKEDTELHPVPPFSGPLFEASITTRTLASTSNGVRSSAESSPARNSRSDVDTLTQTATSVVGGTMV